MNEKQDATDSIRVVKSAKCPSVSHRSTLGYDVGLSPQGDVYFRVTANSAPGAFSRAWMSWKDIQKAIEGPAREKAITSAHLARLCGGGQNTSGFLLAVLKHEGLLKASTAKKRCHELVDDAAFLASVKAWDQVGKSPASNAEAKPHPKVGVRSASTTKRGPSLSAESASLDDLKSVLSTAAKNNLSTSPNEQPSDTTKKAPSRTTKDGTGDAEKKRR